MKIPRRGFLNASIAALILAGAVGAPAAGASTTTGAPIEGAVSWSIAPSDAEGADGRVSFRYTQDPGASVSDFVHVTNFSEQPLTFDLAASDGVVGSDGAFDVLPAAETPTDVGSWVQIQPTVTVDALSSAVVPFTISVPTDAVPGDHPGGIVASLSRVSAESLSAQVGLDARIGARIHMRVAGEIATALAPTALEAEYEMSWNPFAPGRVHVRYVMSNDGNVRLGSVQAAETSGLIPSITSLRVEGFAEQREVLPRQSRDVEGVIEGVWPWGRLDVTIVSDNDLVGEDELAVLVDDSRATVAIAAIPWTQAILLVLLVGLIWLIVWRGRRRRRKAAAALEAARAEGAAAARAHAEADLVKAGDTSA